MDSRLSKIKSLKTKMVSRAENNEVILVPVVNDVADMKEILVLNEVASHIWENIDFYDSFDDIIKDIMKNYDVDESRAINDITEFLNEFEN